MKLTQADVGKMVVIGTPLDPEMVWEEYPEQIGTVINVHQRSEADKELGMEDIIEVLVNEDQHFDKDEWFNNRKVVYVPKDPTHDGIAAVPACCVRAYA